MKKCSKCLQTKSINEFGKQSKSKDGLTHHCKSCRNEHLRQYKQKKLSEPRTCTRCNNDCGDSSHVSYCRNCQRELDKIYTSKPERKAKKKASIKKWRQENKEKIKAYKKERLANPETEKIDKASANKRNRTYYQNNKQKCFDHTARRRARERNAYQEKVDRLKIAERDKWICHICGKKVNRKNMSIDHLIPISQGGEHSKKNVRLAHLSCNQSRGAGRIPAQLFLIETSSFLD